MVFDEFPNEIKFLIFSFIPDLYTIIANVCKEWRDIIIYDITKNNKLPKINIKYISLSKQLLIWVNWSENPYMDHITSEVAKQGNINLLKWINKHKHKYIHGAQFFYNPLVLAGAASSGNISILEYLLSENCLLHESVCESAAEYNQYDTLLWLRNKKCPWNKHTLLAAAKSGNLDMFKYIDQNGLPIYEFAADDIYMAAGASGNIQILQYIYDSTLSTLDDLCHCCVYHGNFDAVKWCHEHKFNWDENCCQIAASKGYLEILKYLHINGCNWNSETCNVAVANGHLNCLKYAHENSCPWDTKTYMKLLQLKHSSRKEHHTLISKYLDDNNCPKHINSNSNSNINKNKLSLKSISQIY